MNWTRIVLAVIKALPAIIEAIKLAKKNKPVEPAGLPEADDEDDL